MKKGVYDFFIAIGFVVAVWYFYDSVKVHEEFELRVSACIVKNRHLPQPRNFCIASEKLKEE